MHSCKRLLTLIILFVLFFFSIESSGGVFTVTNTSNSGAGSLRAAITNVNASTNVSNSIIFNISIPNPNYNSTTGVFTITLTSALPELKKSRVLIDGYSQITFAGNNNTATFRSLTTVGTGPDGLVGTGDDVSFLPINGAEIQIIANYTPRATRKFTITGDTNIVRGLAFVNMRLVFKGNNEGLIEQCTFGINAHSFTDPGAANRITNIISGAGSSTDEGCLEVYDSTRNLIIRNNLFAYAYQRGIYFIDANWNYNLLIEGNEIAYTNRGDGFVGGSIEMAPVYRTAVQSPNDSTSARYFVRKATIRNNVIHDCAGTSAGYENCIEINIKDGSFNVAQTTGRIDSLKIENNTIYRGNVGITMARLILPTFGNQIINNVIRDNRGQGVLLNTELSSSYPVRVAMKTNAMYNNGGLGIDFAPNNILSGVSAGSVNTNDNGDVDVNFPNDGLNFPIIFLAGYVGSDLELTGTSQPGVTVEIYLADNNIAFTPTYATSPATIPPGFTSPLGINGYGEGRQLLYSFTEGDINDLETGTRTYNDDGTGILGARTENRWRVIIPAASLPSGFNLGWRLTSTATNSDGSTSEFGPSPRLIVLPFETGIEFDVKKQGEQAVAACKLPEAYKYKQVTVETSDNRVLWIPLFGIINTASTNLQYVQHKPANGIHYYRLKMVDQNGAVSYSAVKALQFNTSLQPLLVVYPNPSNGNFQLNLPVDFAGKKLIMQVHDMKGALIYFTEAHFQAHQQLQMGLPAGMYRLSFVNKQNAQIQSTFINIQ